MRSGGVFGLAAACAVLVAAWPAAPPARARDAAPVAHSAVVASAGWRSRQYRGPIGVVGDILPTTVGDDGRLYTLFNDGSLYDGLGRDVRSRLATIAGTPPTLGVSAASPPEPVGHVYSNGLISLDGVLYMTRVRLWPWRQLAPFAGLLGISYSTDHGATWHSPQRPFEAPTGNLSFVQHGDDRPASDGWVYAISTEREFNASYLLLGRVRPGIGNVTDPARWEWYRGGRYAPTWGPDANAGRPVLYWHHHITYPRMSYDAALGRYLLTFSYSYADDPPGVFRSGAELMVMEAPHPWGPFALVFRSPYFGPSNGYGASFPVPWQGPVVGGAQELWLLWAANFDGCDPVLDCRGRYGLNFRQLRLTLASR
jgi:hypothetical protein